VGRKHRPARRTDRRHHRVGADRDQPVAVGEPHGLRKRPNQKDYTIRLQQYFDHYLKGAPAPAWMEKGVRYIERERTELSTMGDKK
jgi:hypothetical protein